MERLRSFRFILLVLGSSFFLSCSAAVSSGGGSSSGSSGGSGSGSGSTTYSVQLSWTAPTTNSDATPLTDLTGYRVYYGTSTGTYTQNIDVGNVTTYNLTGLALGTYYFTVRAYDNDGNLSANATEQNISLP